MSDNLDHIPGLGHAKAIYHYIDGDTEAGNEAMYKSTRMTAVIGGGVAAGGAGGMLGGLVVDATASALTGEPRGYVAGACEIRDDLSAGRFPGRGLGTTFGLAATDALVGSASSTVYGLATSKSAEIYFAQVDAHALMTPFMGVMFDEVRRASERAAKNSSQSSGGSGGSGGSSGGSSGGTTGGSSSTTSGGSGGSASASSGAGQPPPGDERNNRANGGQHYQTTARSHMHVFLEILVAESLADATMGRPPISLFYELTAGQLDSLKSLIRDLRKNGHLKELVEVVQRLFDAMDADDIDFENFLNLVKFAACCIGEYLFDHIEETEENYLEVRRPRSIQLVWQRIETFSTHVLNTFNRVRVSVERENAAIFPRYRDPFTTAYHFFKHRILLHLPDRRISESEYFQLINDHLERVKTLDVYAELMDPNNPRIKLTYEKFHASYERRFRIVLKFEDGHWELLTAFFVDRWYKGDEDGDEFIDNQPL